MNRSAHELTTDLGDEVMNLPGAAVSTWVSPFAAGSWAVSAMIFGDVVRPRKDSLAGAYPRLRTLLGVALRAWMSSA